jgi:hypothetical protein
MSPADSHRFRPGVEGADRSQVDRTVNSLDLQPRLGPQPSECAAVLSGYHSLLSSGVGRSNQSQGTTRGPPTPRETNFPGPPANFERVDGRQIPASWGQDCSQTRMLLAVSAAAVFCRVFQV